MKLEFFATLTKSGDVPCFIDRVSEKVGKPCVSCANTWGNLFSWFPYDISIVFS